MLHYSSVYQFTGMGLIYLVSTGVGVWGNNNPVNWGWAIVNFVFWIGIGHAGTLISTNFMPAQAKNGEHP